MGNASPEATPVQACFARQKLLDNIFAGIARLLVFRSVLLAAFARIIRLFKFSYPADAT